MCPFPKMRNLISLGGPHQGVFQYPRCNQMFGEIQCKHLKFKANLIAYHRLKSIFSMLQQKFSYKFFFTEYFKNL